LQYKIKVYCVNERGGEGAVVTVERLKVKNDEAKMRRHKFPM